ncbi:MAG: potassium channel family protein [Gemmataceae bacterium]
MSPSKRPPRYLALLIAMILLILAYPTVQNHLPFWWIYDVLMTVFFLLVLINVFQTHHHRLVATLLGLPTVAGLWLGYALPGLHRASITLTFHLLATLFMVHSLIIILLDIHRHSEVDADTVRGALCGYLLTGLAFAHIYCMMEIVTPGSIRSTDQTLDPIGAGGATHFKLTYFSFLTLTTVGYGDMVPATDPARSFAMVEAMLGQFYVAVLIGELIGKRVSYSLINRPTSPDDHS